MSKTFASSKVRGYAVAILAVAVAALMRQSLNPLLLTELPMLFFMLPVILAAAYGGIGPGLFATALGLLTGVYLFFRPAYSLRLEDSASMVRALVFVVQGVLISVVVEVLRRGRRRVLTGQTALLDSEARYRAFFDLVAVGTAQVDSRTGHFIDVNSAFCRITGYSRKELLERTFSEITHPDDRKLDAEKYGRLSSGEVPAYWTEKRYIRNDGSPVWVRLDVAAVRDPAGDLIRSIAVIQDISERKRAEAEVERQRHATELERQRLRAVLDLLPVGVFISDAAGNILETNPAAEAIWGSGPRLFDDYAGWLPHSGRRLKGEEWALARALTDGTHTTAEEIEIETFDGRRKTILNYALPIRDGGGHITGGVAINVEITDRKRAENALRENEQRLRATFENAGVGIAEVDANGTIMESNERFRWIVGRSEEELRGLTIHELTHPGERERSRRFHRDLVEGRRDRFAEEKRYLRSDGSQVWARATVSAVRDGEGRFLRAIGVMEDISERKQAEAALRESEARLRLAIESPELGTFDYDPPTGKLVWSEFAKRHFGLSPGAEVSYEVFVRGLHPDDRERVEKVVAEVLRPEGGGQYALEHRTIGIEDGEERWLSAWGRVHFDSEGRPIRFVGVTQDITERKRAERALRESERRERARAAELEAIMDAVPVVTFISRDPECREMVGSRACYELLRLPHGTNLSKTPAEGQGSPPFRMMKDGKDIPSHELPMQRAGATGRPVRDWEMDLVLEDGTRRTVLGDAVPMLDADGHPWGVIAAFLDITERKRAEEHLRQSQKLESVGLLAGGIAHDFNNLLVGIVGNASLAQEMLPPENPAVELLRSVVKIGEQAAHLTRQMLAYAGKGRFVVEPVNLSDLVPEMIGLVRPSLSKKIALHLELDSDLPRVEADRGQMQQVFMNLVLNAAEAIGGQAGVVSVKTGVRQVETHEAGQASVGELRPGKYIYLEVRDSGCGMNEATRSRIFDPFYSTKFTGRGLGLAAVAGIVRGHHGAIQISSEPGKGSCFVVLFPAGSGAAVVTPAEARHRALHGAGTVLVVDDEEIVRQVVKRSLERFGFQVLLAESGKAAIDIFKRHPGEIAATILDLNMPEMSGEEALPLLRKIRPGVKFIVSSGYSEAEAMPLFVEDQVAGFIQKPYTAGVIAEKVQSILE